MIRAAFGLPGEGMTYDAQPLPAATAPARLQLLCVLVKNRDGSTHQLPVHGMQPMPPRVGVAGRFDRALVTQAGFILRETHARRPAAKVVVHGVRLGQADALRPDLRTFRGLSHDC